MTGLLLDETTNDLVIINGELQLATDNLLTLRQRIYITLNAWLGEWKLNINFGIPYRQNIFVKGVTKEGIDTIFLAKIAEFEEVISIDDFASEYNSRTRQYDITRLVIRTTQGEEGVVTQFKPDVDTVYQPSAVQPAGNLCGVVSPALANQFHEFLHFDLVGLWD